MTDLLTYPQSKLLLPAMVRVEGCDAYRCLEKKDSKPVKINDFAIARHPVTQAQWRAVMGNAPSRFKGDNRPVEKVTWFDAIAYCNELSKLMGKERVYVANGKEFDKVMAEEFNKNGGEVKILDANGYRLPTEEEWEYAARGGDKLESYTFAGSDEIDEVAWYDKNSGGETKPVAHKKPNSLGLYDMSGNVWEWTGSWYDEKNSDRVSRGGSWGNPSEYCQVSFRACLRPGRFLDNKGFRLVSQL